MALLRGGMLVVTRPQSGAHRPRLTSGQLCVLLQKRLDYFRMTTGLTRAFTRAWVRQNIGTVPFQQMRWDELLEAHVKLDEMVVMHGDVGDIGKYRPTRTIEQFIEGLDSGIE